MRVSENIPITTGTTTTQYWIHSRGTSVMAWDTWKITYMCIYVHKWVQKGVRENDGMQKPPMIYEPPLSCHCERMFKHVSPRVH